VAHVFIQTEKRLWHRTPPWFQAFCLHLCDPTWCPFLLPLSQKCKHSDTHN
jgi:hypothetical protein